MPKIGTKKDFAINKSISLPLALAEKVLERAEENNRSFSEELTSLIRISFQVLADQELREQQRAQEEAKKYLK